VRPWLSSRILTKRTKKKLSKLNGKLMNQEELKKLKSRDKNSFLRKSKRMEKL